jgi:hypothetical protein
MKTIEAPKVDEKMVHDPFKKKKEKKTVIAYKTPSRSLARCEARWELKKARRYRQRN